VTLGYRENTNGTGIWLNAKKTNKKYTKTRDSRGGKTRQKCVRDQLFKEIFLFFVWPEHRRRGGGQRKEDEGTIGGGEVT
jgi:hypothetical protein